MDQCSEREFTDRKVHGSSPLDLPCLGLGNLAVSYPSCLLLVAWQQLQFAFETVENACSYECDKPSLVIELGCLMRLHEQRHIDTRIAVTISSRGIYTCTGRTPSSRLTLSVKEETCLLTSMIVACIAIRRLGQPDSIQAHVLSSAGMADRHRKGVTAERFKLVLGFQWFDRASEVLKKGIELRFIDPTNYVQKRADSLSVRKSHLPEVSPPGTREVESIRSFATTPSLRIYPLVTTSAANRISDGHRTTVLGFRGNALPRSMREMRPPGRCLVAGITILTGMPLHPQSRLLHGPCKRTYFELGLLSVSLCGSFTYLANGSCPTMLEGIALNLRLSGLPANICVATLNGQNGVSFTRLHCLTASIRTFVYHLCLVPERDSPEGKTTTFLQTSECVQVRRICVVSLRMLSDLNPRLSDQRLVRFESISAYKPVRSVPVHNLRKTTIEQNYRFQLAQRFSRLNQQCTVCEHVDKHGNVWKVLSGLILQRWTEHKEASLKGKLDSVPQADVPITPTPPIGQRNNDTVFDQDRFVYLDSRIDADSPAKDDVFTWLMLLIMAWGLRLKKLIYEAVNGMISFGNFYQGLSCPSYLAEGAGLARMRAGFCTGIPRFVWLSRTFLKQSNAISCGAFTKSDKFQTIVRRESHIIRIKPNAFPYNRILIKSSQQNIKIKFWENLRPKCHAAFVRLCLLWENAFRLRTNHPTSESHNADRLCRTKSKQAMRNHGADRTECSRLHVSDIVRVCEDRYPTDEFEKSGIRVHHWEFSDGSPPPDNVLSDWFNLLRARFYTEPKNTSSNATGAAGPVAVHCIAGYGRAPVLVAVALMELGMPCADAIELIRRLGKPAIIKTVNFPDLRFRPTWNVRSFNMYLQVTLYGHLSKYEDACWLSLASRMCVPPEQHLMSVHLTAFNVHTLKQAGQQAALALTLDSPGSDLCCVSRAKIQDARTVDELTDPSLSTGFRLRISGDPEATVVECAGFGIILGHRVEVSLLDLIPVDSRLHAVLLATFVKESHKWEVDRCLFMVSTYSPTDCSLTQSKTP
ncbi:protein tyrosine phosphatase type IVA 3 [Clonorchis sinensis]|uniref:Protein tyrosine phosphatase type IVA 3 n=1 Tax=Clonorchis sinensis TaxID=79923 RepID=G7YK53_CLOSI|nr:protein tyrosine phosphatase type IVA 3 [Clonorchis sinensis]